MITKQQDIENDGPALSRAEFWQRVAAFAFGAWALAVPIAAGAIVSSVMSISKAFDAYVLVMERRVTQIEERQNRVLQLLEKYAADIENMKDNQRRPR